MIELCDALLVASGLHRHCYEHPDNPHRCIKVVYNGDQTETGREVRYYRLLSKRGIDWSRIPQFHGFVETNLGQGAVFDLTRDCNGEVSRSLQSYLDDPSRRPDWRQLQQWLQDLLDYMIQDAVVTMNLKAKNLLLQKMDSQSDRLVIADSLGCSELLPVSSHIKFMARRKIRRRFSRFESALLTFYSCLCPDTETTDWVNHNGVSG